MPLDKLLFGYGQSNGGYQYLQEQHLIPQARWAAFEAFLTTELGLDVNDGANLQFLAADARSSLILGVATHRGSHPSYNDLNNNFLTATQDKLTIAIAEHPVGSPEYETNRANAKADAEARIKAFDYLLRYAHLHEDVMNPAYKVKPIILNNVDARAIISGNDAAAYMQGLFGDYSLDTLTGNSGSAEAAVFQHAFNAYRNGGEPTLVNAALNRLDFTNNNVNWNNETRADILSRELIVWSTSNQQLAADQTSLTKANNAIAEASRATFQVKFEAILNQFFPSGSEPNDFDTLMSQLRSGGNSSITAEAYRDLARDAVSNVRLLTSADITNTNFAQNLTKEALFGDAAMKLSSGDGFDNFHDGDGGRYQVLRNNIASAVDVLVGAKDNFQDISPIDYTQSHLWRLFDAPDNIDGLIDDLRTSPDVSYRNFSDFIHGLSASLEGLPASQVDTDLSRHVQAQRVLVNFIEETLGDAADDAKKKVILSDDFKLLSENFGDWLSQKYAGQNPADTVIMKELAYLEDPEFSQFMADNQKLLTGIDPGDTPQLDIGKKFTDFIKETGGNVDEALAAKAGGTFAGAMFFLAKSQLAQKAFENEPEKLDKWYKDEAFGFAIGLAVAGSVMVAIQVGVPGAQVGLVLLGGVALYTEAKEILKLYKDAHPDTLIGGWAADLLADWDEMEAKAAADIKPYVDAVARFSNNVYEHIAFGEGDVTVADSLQNTLIIGAGNGVLNGNANGDTIYHMGEGEVSAGDGDDIIFLRNTDNAGLGTTGVRVYAGEGNDTVLGGIGNDDIYGEAGNDELFDARGTNLLDGGDGTDRVSYTQLDGTVTFTLNGYQFLANTTDPEFSGIDIIQNVEIIEATNQDDVFYLTSLEALQGSAPGEAALSVDFSDGIDSLDFSGYGSSVYLSASAGGATSYSMYREYDPTIYQNNTVIGLDLGYVVKQGKGFLDPAINFDSVEKITGSGQADIISVHNSGNAETITLEGGGGNDTLHAGKTQAIIKGGADNDTIYTSGAVSEVHGGSGRDHFELGPNTWVMDATDDETIDFGAFSLTGGVQFPWQEGGFAYWQPFSAILQGVGGTIAGKFAEFWTTFSMDIQFMSWMRYAQTDSGQLIAQMGRGYGEIVIENYNLNLETGLGTGGITVFSVDYTEPNSASLSEFKRFIDLALQQGFGVRSGGYDPLVIDLDKDGLDLTRQNQREVYFDLDGDNFGERTGWVREDDGLLAVDLNSDGKINNISELFGDENTSGLQALAAYDSNGDGVINALDAQFSDLLIWQDLNQNGVVDAGELNDLATHGIVEISLTGRAPDLSVLGGNDVREIADVTFSDGSTSIAGDVWFEVNQVDSRYLGDTTVSAAAAALPSIRGFGDMASLQVVMTSDAALLTMVSDFAALPVSTDWAGYQTATANILLQWADVSAVAATALGSDGFDLQKLAYLETAAGQQLAPRDETTGDVLDTNASELLDAWNAAVADQAARLLLQTQFGSYLDGITYDEARDVFVADAGNSTALADTFENFLTALPADPVAAEQMWSGTFGPALASSISIMERHDGIDMRTDFVVGQLVRAHDASAHPISLDQLVTGLGFDNVIVGGPLNRADAEGMLVYVGTDGNDTFQGGDAQDVYVFDSVIGHDVIVDSETGHTPWGDRLRLVHLNEDDVEISRDGVDLLITVSATGETIRVQNQFVTPVYNQAGRQISENWGIEDIQFADGTIFEAIDIGAAANRGSDTAADHIIGTAFDDEINGGLMDDILEGGDGGDFYVYQAGGGHDIIRDQMVNPFNDRQDLLMLTDGLSLEDMRFERVGNSDDLTIRFSDDPADTNSILIEGQFAYSSLGYDNEYALDQRIEGFGSLEDAPINWVEVQQRVIETYTTSGDDITYGFGTTDIFDASAGNDWLSGGDSGDLYQFGFGSGHDTIEDNQLYQEIFLNILPGGQALGTDDYLAFGEGITVADVTFSVVDGTRDLLISIDDDPNSAGASDTMRIVNQFDGQRVDLFSLFGIAWFDRVEQFAFSDGTVLTWEDILDIVTIGDAGDNNLIGDHRADTLVGNGGNDHLSGGDDSDTYIYNLGDGNDVIADNQYDIFTPSDDTLQFGAGITSADVSFSFGPADNDVLLSLTDGSTITLVNQLAGYDSYIFGVNWSDRIETIEFTDAQGQVVETIGWDAIMTTLVTQQQTAGDDTIYGIDSDFGAWGDIIDGGAGNDTIFGHGGHDIIAGGTGNDTSDGGWGDDTYIFNPGDGIDTIQDTGSGLDSGDKLVIGYNVADVSVSRPAGTNDIVLTFAGSTDQITVINALSGQTYSAIETYEFLDATWTPVSIAQSLVDGQITEGADIIIGSGVINGLGGNDLIWGEDQADTLSGGLGDDFLDGGEGTDTYLYSAGDGHDTIHDYGNGIDTDDLLQITGYTRAQTTIEIIDGLNQIDLVFTGSGDRISLIDPLASEAAFRGINLIEFVDEAVTWTTADLSALVVAAQSTAGDDVILGSAVADIIDGGAGDDDIAAGDGKDDVSGGAGNDRLDGGTDDDTYRFGQGDGKDTITETGNGLDNADKLIISDYLSSQTLVQRVAGTENIVLTFAGSTDTITLVRALTGSYLNQIETYEFAADGTLWTPTDLAAQILLQEVTAGDDDLQGFDTADVISGGVGNDSIHGLGGNDILSGDIGDDFIDGGEGDDTYLYTIGDGHDTIHDFGNGLDKDDLLQISGYTRAQTTIEIVNGLNQIDLVFTLDGDRISLIDALHSSASARGINLIEFVDEGVTWDAADLSAAVMAAQSTSGDDVITGSDFDDIITGGLGNDTIDGGKGDDTYIYNAGDGHDTIHDFGNGLDKDDLLQISGYTRAQTTIEIVNGMNQIDLVFTGTGDRISLIDPLVSSASFRGINLIEFVDEGVTWDAADISAAVMAAQSTSGDDVIAGSDIDDIITGGLGNDTIDGGKGDDTFIFNLGDGHDTIADNGNGLDGDDRLIINGYLVADVTATGIGGNDVELTFAGTSDKITLLNALASGVSQTIDYYEFVDGGTTTVWTKQDLADAVAGNAGSGDLTVTHLGTAAAETINATSGNDVINGLEGDDTLSGKAGDDVYLYASGDGNDTIADSEYAAGDALKLTDLNAADIELSRSGFHMLVTDLITGQVITDEYHFLSATSLNRGIDTIEFADGSSWDYATINTNAWIRGTSGNETLTGSNLFDETLQGYAGDDTLRGKDGADTYVYASGDGNDTIDDSEYASGDVLKLTNLNAADIQLSKSGTSLLITVLAAGQVITDTFHFLSATNLNRGIDTIEFADGSSWDYATINANAWIRGTSGNETLTGSNLFDETLQGYGGDDTLQGENGADTYVYASGDGNDTINDDVYVAGDVLRLTDLNAADITLSKSGFHMLITDVTTGQVITDNYHFLSTTSLNRGIDTIEFADGSSWDYDTINAVARIETTALADTATGTTGDDVIIGLGGNDTLTGLGGADTFVFAAGDGSDTITDFSVADVDRIDVSAYGFASNTGFTGFSFDGTDTIVDFNGTDQVTVAGVDLTTQPNPDDAFIFV